MYNNTYKFEEWLKPLQRDVKADTTNTLKFSFKMNEMTTCYYQKHKLTF